MKLSEFAADYPQTTENRPSARFHMLLLATICMIAMIAAPSMRAQATGSFSGTVSDKSGSAIPEATVVATAEATGMARDVKTDSSGHYLLPLLPVGNYTVRVDAHSFQSAESKDLNLQVDQARELDFSLVPATVATTVAVSGDAVAVETTNPSLGQVITGAAGVAASVEWPRLRSARHAHRRRHGRDEPQQLFHVRQRQRGRRARFLLSVGGRFPTQQHGLASGWSRQ